MPSDETLLNIRDKVTLNRESRFGRTVSLPISQPASCSGAHLQLSEGVVSLPALPETWSQADDSGNVHSLRQEPHPVSASLLTPTGR